MIRKPTPMLPRGFYKQKWLYRKIPSDNDTYTNFTSDLTTAFKKNKQEEGTHQIHHKAN